jgi:ABC-type Fe3+-siderophore transport system permease subunit
MAQGNVECTYVKRSKRWKLSLTLLIIALVVTVIVCLNVGYAPISFSEILNILGKQIPFLGDHINSSSFTTTNQAIILQIRLPEF